MKGMAGSQHFMRVVPDTEKIKPGYLYAYLSSRFGVPIVVSGTYGAIIQHIEPHHIANLPVPRLGAVEDHAHNLAQRAANNRVLATKLIEHAIKEAYSALGMIVKEVGTKLNTPSLTIQSSSLLLKRMDAYYYSSENSEARQAFDRAGDLFGNENLGDIADVWIPNIFKRLYAEDPNYGCPYFTGKAIYELFPTTPLFLKREVAQNYRLVLSAGMILIQDSGQISGLIGRPVQVGRHLEGAACTNNMVRIQTPDLLDNGYLFALLSTHYGIRLLKREASGSSIPHLDEGRIKRLAIPWPAQSIRLSIGTNVVKALHLRDEAVDMENKARALVERAIEEGGR
jgi:type I restriction enzyme S subunit